MKKRERKYFYRKKVNKGIIHYIQADEQSSCKGNLVWESLDKSKVKFENNDNGRMSLYENFSKV